VLATEVPYWSEIERMSVRRAPMPVIAPNGAAAQLYTALWTEITGRLERGGLHEPFNPASTDWPWRLRPVDPEPVPAPAADAVAPATDGRLH
jgi:hypothetical protein